MSITYPLTIPTHTGVRSIVMRAMNTVAVSASPFTGAEQTIAWPKQQWAAEVSLPPMKRADAERWIAWLMSLRGRYGTFLMGDPTGTAPRGTATSATVSGSTSSASLTVTMTGSLLAGDYIQLGTGSTATLHKVLVDQSGSGTLEVWPALRRDVTAEAVTLTGAAGRFRLASNDTEWNADAISAYGVTFAANEAI